MSFTPFKIKVDKGVHGVLSSRSSKYKSGPHYEAATRNPAWCYVKCDGVVAPDYPTTFEGVYQGSFKPGVMLKSCVFRSGGDFGLFIELEGEIQCNTRSQFERVQKAYCKLGAIVSTAFGYGPLRGSSYSGTKFTNGFRICRFSFTATAEGFWLVKFTAIAPGTTIREISVLNAVDTKGRTYLNEGISMPVKGIADLIMYYAQGNGQRALDQMQDGEVVNTPLGPLIVYTSDHLYSNAGTDLGGSADKAKPEAKSANNIVYISLQFLVELFNQELFPVVNRQVSGGQQGDFKKLKIVLHPTFSKSYVEPGLRSAYPTKVLLLGLPVKGGMSGDYVPIGLSGVFGAGKDFEKGPGLPFERSCYDGQAGGRHVVKLSNVFFERDLVVAALNKSYTETKVAETTDVKKTDEGGVKVEQFFDNIFTTLSETTGGMMKLRLTMHPDASAGSSSENPDVFHQLIVVDENNGYFPDAIPCIVFDPLGGDGSTRTCVVQSEVGSKEYQGWAFSSVKKKADPPNEAKGIVSNGNTDGRIAERERAKNNIYEIVKLPGALGRSAFDEIHMSSIREQLGTMMVGSDNAKAMDMCVYPGLSLNVELDGVWGFQPGNAIMSTQVPKDYFSANTYFFVETVEHVFDGNTSDWVTRLKSRLSFHSSVNYQYL